MRVPAICNTCGAMFPSAFDLSAGARHTTFSGCVTGPCPRCGGNGRILDGTYDFIDGVLTLLKGPEWGTTELRRLETVLNRHKEKSEPFSKLEEEVQEQVPQFSSALSLFPRSRPELYAFITMVIAIINLMITLFGKQADKPIAVNQVINNVYQQYEYHEVLSAPKSRTVPTPRVPKIGRNAPCPCGSGKKHKRCCGK